MRTYYRVFPVSNPKGFWGGFWCGSGGFIPIVCLAFLLLTGCASLEDQATLTAQVRRNVQQATHQAEFLQNTELAKVFGVTSTHQANRQQTAQAELDQQATIDAKAATEQVYAAQRTAEALELERFIERAQNWPAFVADEFDQPAYEWPISSETFPGGNISWNIAGGKYRWTASANRGFAYWIYPTAQAVSDFYLAVDVQNIGGTTDSEAGLIFHVSERDYWCYLISGEGDLFIGLRINSEWQLSMPMGSSAIRNGEPNRLTVINQNEHYFFLINGRNYMSMGKNSLPVGPAGLMINLWNAGDQTIWEFDHFELRTPAPQATPAP